MLKPNGNIRWQILSLIFFATTINYIDRRVIGILKPFIADDFGWSEADYGYIVMAFQIAYAIGLVSMGRFIDKFGTRIGYVWAILVWSIAGMAHAAARSVTLLEQTSVSASQRHFPPVARGRYVRCRLPDP